MEAELKKNDSQQYELTGELSFQTVPDLSEQIEMLLQENAELVIGLNKVSRADSAGVAMLVEWQRRARQLGKSLQFLDIPEQMLSIVRVSGLDSILPLSRSTV
jgi:phospholipid transport system transporter-binding protein